MEPVLLELSESNKGVINSVINRNSFILNFFMSVIFIAAVSIFIYISYKDKNKFTKDNTLRKLLFIKQNT